MSSGPTINDWHIDNGTQAPTDCGGIDGNQWTLHVSVGAAAGISNVTIYDGPNLFRCFMPGGTSFSTTIVGLQDKQHSFVMVVTDQQGRQAISGELDTSSREQGMGMCFDLQNVISGVNAPDPTNTELLSYGCIGTADTGCDSGYLTVMGMTTENIVPTGLDPATLAGFKHATSHLLTTNTGTESSVAQRAFYDASRDVSVIDNIYQGYWTVTGSTVHMHRQYALC